MTQQLRELSVETNITATISGLKAIQREAKKATQALRELEAADKSAWTFHVDDVIECAGQTGYFRCICADKDVAVFAPTKRTADGWHTDYSEMFTYANSLGLRDSIAREYHVVEVNAGHGGI